MNESKRKSWSLSGAAILVGWLLTVGGLVWAASADRSAIVSRVNASTAQLNDHEQRLRVIEPRLSEIAIDVKWIRKHLEQGAPAWP